MKPIPSPISRQALDLMNKAQELTQRIDILEKAKCPECGKMTKMGTCKSKCAMEKGDKGEKDKYCMKNFGKKYSECSKEQKEQCDKHCDKNNMEKGLEMVEHDGKKVPKFAADGKGAKDMKNKEMPMDMPMKKPKDMEEGKKPKKKEGDKGRKIKVKKPKMRDMPLPKDMDMDMPSPVDMQKAVAEGSQPGFITSYDSSPMGVMFMSETGGQTRNAYYTTNQYPYNAEDVANKGATSVQVSLDKLASMLNPHEGGGVSRLDDGGVLRDDPY